jgi:hypothetical protein
VRVAAALLACALAACGGASGTISVSLVTAPNSTVLDGVTHLRMTLTTPHEVIEADRVDGSFSLALDVDAAGITGALVIEGFDGTGALVACGQSPPFPVSAITAHVAVYMAAPMSIAAAPMVLSPARTGVASAALAFGAAFAGGADATGAPSDAIAIYNAFDHTLTPQKAMPVPRTQLQIGVGLNASLFLYGGFDATHAATGNFVRFDASVTVGGSYADLGEQTSLPRAGELAVAIGPDHFLLTGMPVLDLDIGRVTARSDIASLPATAATTTTLDGSVVAVFVGPTGIVRFSDGAFSTLSTTPRVGAGIAPLPDNKFIIIGGGSSATDLTADALVVDALAGSVAPAAGILVTPRNHPGVAATGRHVVITGGVSAAGAPIGSTEIIDATSLAKVTTLTADPRGAPFAIAFPNDQVLIGGDTTPSSQLLLFTPPPPPH